MKILSLVVGLLAATIASGVSAQAYPSKPVTMVVPVAAGSPTDTFARVIAQAMEKRLGVEVSVENKFGAGGTMGASDVARAAPDGYKVLLWDTGMATVPALYRKVPFDPLKDFAYIGLVNQVPMTLLTRAPSMSSLKELVAQAKANPSKLTLANAGVGSASYLCGLLFQEAIEAKLVTLPYKRSSAAMNDLIGGNVDILCDQTANTSAQIVGGRVQALALTAPKRLDTFKNLPTAAEAGLRGFEMSAWHGIYAPKGTPQPVINKLVLALQDALKDPAVTKRFADLGATTVTAEQATPDGLARHLKAEIDKWTPIIKKAGDYAD